MLAHRTQICVCVGVHLALLLKRVDFPREPHDSTLVYTWHCCFSERSSHASPTIRRWCTLGTTVVKANADLTRDTGADKYSAA